MLAVAARRKAGVPRCSDKGYVGSWIPKTSSLLDGIRERVEDLVHVPLSNFEDLQVVKYGPPPHLPPFSLSQSSILQSATNITMPI